MKREEQYRKKLPSQTKESEYAKDNWLGKNTWGLTSAYRINFLKLTSGCFGC